MGSYETPRDRRVDVVEVFWPSRRCANFEPKSEKGTWVGHSEGFGAARGMDVHTAAIKTAKKRMEEIISQAELIESK